MKPCLLLTVAAASFGLYACSPSAEAPAAPEPAAGPGATVIEASTEPDDSDVPDKETSKDELYDMATELKIKRHKKMSKEVYRAGGAGRMQVLVSVFGV